FLMAGPRQRVVKNRELLEQQLRFLERRHVGRPFWTTVDTVMHRETSWFCPHTELIEDNA
ncbi:MAG: hypothetical protein WA730_02175, partial [Pseudolabrys sp.]